MDRVGHTHAHAPHFIKNQNVKKMKSSLQDDVIGKPSTCEGIASHNMDMVSLSPPSLRRGRIAHLESMCANLLSLVGEDSILIDEASSQMKKNLELVSSLKACATSERSKRSTDSPVDRLGSRSHRLQQGVSLITSTHRTITYYRRI